MFLSLLLAMPPWCCQCFLVLANAMGGKSSLASTMGLTACCPRETERGQMRLNGLMPPKCPMPLSELDSPIITPDTVWDFSHWFCCLESISDAYSWPSLFSGLACLRGLSTLHKTCRAGSECFKYQAPTPFQRLINVYSAQWNLPHALMGSVLSLSTVFQSICWENCGMSWFYIRHNTMQDLEAWVSVWTQARAHVDSIYPVAWENL